MNVISPHRAGKAMLESLSSYCGNRKPVKLMVSQAKPLMINQTQQRSHSLSIRFVEAEGKDCLSSRRRPIG